MMLYWQYYTMGIILLPGIIFSIIAEIKVQSNYNKYKKLFAECGKTASEIARLFLDNAGLSDIQVVRVRGELSDHYNHKHKIVALSDGVYNSPSVAAIGIACHEVGHALQYKRKYFPIRLRNLIIPICNFANSFLWVLIILGAIFYYTNLGNIALWVGVGTFAVALLINLITLPVEYNASKQALEVLEKSTVLNPDEVKCARKVLNSAALTYVASTVVSILNLLRLLLLLARRSRRD